MDDDGPNRKGIRVEDNPLLKPEIQLQIASFLDAVDLQAWDLVGREFSAVSSNQWGYLAHTRFGVASNTGKAGWKLGLSLLQKPILIEMTDSEDFGNGADGYAGSPKMATNQSILVTVSDDMDGGGIASSFPRGRNGICIRDAHTLHYYRTVASPIVNWNVAVCGRVGCEILVTSNSMLFCAIRGDLKETWDLISMLSPEDQLILGHMVFGYGIPLLGCQNHLIVAACGRVYLYDVDTADGSLVKLKLCVPISAELDQLLGENNFQETLRNPENLAWCEDQEHFTFFEPITKSLCIWKLDKEHGSINRVKSISSDTVEIRDVVLSENFIVGCSKAKKLFVWDRQNGELRHEALCDVPEDDEVDEDDICYPLSMIVVSGDLLVTSSIHGNAFCVWNLNKINSKDALIARHADAFEAPAPGAQLADELPDGPDVTSMVHLKGLNAFVCVQYAMMAWAFPTDKTMRKKLLSIRRRTSD